jgi:Protein of unknown function (DUF3574)
MQSFRLAAAMALAVTMASPAFSQGVTCREPLRPMIEIVMMFGRNIGGELGVSETLWSEFVAREITPRFPAGLTIDDALGQWRDPERETLIQEPSKELRIIVPEGTAVDGEIAAIVDAYKERFQQQSVAVMMRPACVSF